MFMHRWTSSHVLRSICFSKAVSFCFPSILSAPHRIRKQLRDVGVDSLFKRCKFATSFHVFPFHKFHIFSHQGLVGSRPCLNATSSPADMEHLTLKAEAERRIECYALSLRPNALQLEVAQREPYLTKMTHRTQTENRCIDASRCGTSLLFLETSPPFWIQYFQRRSSELRSWHTWESKTRQVDHTASAGSLSQWETVETTEKWQRDSWQD